MTTRSNVVQYESNLSTNCSNTDLVALVISFFFLSTYWQERKEEKRIFRNISSKRKTKKRERTKYKRIKEQEKRLITSYRLITIDSRGASALFPDSLWNIWGYLFSFLFLIYLLIPLMFSQCQKSRESLLPVYKWYDDLLFCVTPKKYIWHTSKQNTKVQSKKDIKVRE
jgi:hypothetical protein